MSMTREQLIELVNKIMAVEGTEEEEAIMIETLESNVLHPRVLDLIFHPQSEGLPDEPTAEQIVDAALAYKPIAL
ncbi:bacteriocin immunity protein [Streptomyces sp. NPDC048751]|uniref:bacteriocin immunity protein n=1 Tax=Streptomyces sp. NPDC048751 TaxID=3365591 RepID=UPI0037170980